MLQTALTWITDQNDRMVSPSHHEFPENGGRLVLGGDESVRDLIHAVSGNI